MKVIKESAARIASSTEVSPVKSPGLEDDRAALVKELADVKKRFLAVAKKKQADFAKRVLPPEPSSGPRSLMLTYPQKVCSACCVEASQRESVVGRANCSIARSRLCFR